VHAPDYLTVGLGRERADDILGWVKVKGKTILIAPNWAGLAGSPWHHLDAAAQRGIVSRKQGIYRLRCADRPALIYIAISDKLSSRLGGLHRARSRPPRYRGHSAATCVVQHEAQATSSRCRERNMRM
jgi:hypothetical protein